MKSLGLTFLLVSGILVVSLMLVSPKPCWASSSNTTTSLGMSIAESNMELEFMMGSEFGRMLGGSVSGLRPLDVRPVFACGRGNSYCLTGKRDVPVTHCGTYTRGCH